MANIDRAFNKSDYFYEFSRRYFDYLLDIKKYLDPNELNMFVDEFINLGRK